MSALILAVEGVSVAQNVAFGIIAALMIYAALRVVTTSNVVHAALWLVIVLTGIAAQYILAAAEFVAVSQVLVYVGAVMVLFLFGIMLTRAQIGQESNLNNSSWAIGIPGALLLLGLLSWVVIADVKELNGVNSDGVIVGRELPFVTEGLADQMLSPYLIPFFAISFILLVAAVGAIVLARKD